MMYLNNKKKIINPIIDKILTNPLKFIQNNSLESTASTELKSDKLILLSNKMPAESTLSQEASTAAEPQTAPKPSPAKSNKRSLSLADAVAAYTGKQYGKTNKKRKVKELSDSEEDEGEEIVDESAVEETKLDDKTDDVNSSSNEIFESANEYTPSDSDKSDGSYSLEKSEKSESESLSEEPEDLNQLKQDLKRDEIEAEIKQEQEQDQAQVQQEPSKLQVEAPVPTVEKFDISKYNDFNEKPIDRGSNGSNRINKSYPKKYLHKKPLGLLNQGVTCYMNTAIQSMIHIPAITNYLNEIHNGKHNNHLPSKSVSHVLAELSQRIWNLDNNKKKYIHPKRIINRLEDINCMMSEWQQEDSHEYFMSLMSRLQEDSTPKGVKLNKSIIYDIFGGLLNQTVVCQSCKTKSVTKQEFYDLSLGFKKTKGSSYTIEKSIRDFFNSETIRQDKENSSTGYYCEKCKANHTATKVSTIDRAPEYLTVHLKRFKFNGSQSMKVKQSIKYSNTIDLSEYTTSKMDAKYKLISIISHEGRSLSSGHYISHCLQPDKSWYTYDDEYINKINEFQALNDPSAYVLIYTKLTPKSS